MHLQAKPCSLPKRKWLWIPIDGNTRGEDILELLKIKRRPNRNGCTNQ